MRRAAMLFTLGMIGTGYCLDEYLPIEAKKLEIDAAYNYVSANGAYDADSKKQDVIGSPALNLVPLQVKYGVMPGLDVSVAWAFQSFNKDAGDKGGFGQPDVAVKYALTDIGLGFFADYTVPVATGDFSDPTPGMALAFGALYSKTFMPQFRLTSQAGYWLNFEDGNKIKTGNIITVLAKPEFVINANAGAYLGLRYDMWGEAAFDGTSIGSSDASLFTLFPGWNATWLPNVATEINVPITLMGKNSGFSGKPSYWGINANVYVTLL
jgi:hypothetical protein